MCSTLHAMVNFHHKVKFYNHAFNCQNTAPAVACHQKCLWGWNGYAQTCNKANFRKHNTRGCQVTSLFHSIMIFTMKLGQKSQNPRNFCFTVFHIVPDLRKMNFYHKFTRIYHLSWSVAGFASFSDIYQMAGDNFLHVLAYAPKLCNYIGEISNL